jgi:hypothetical protein
VPLDTFIVPLTCGPPTPRCHRPQKPRRRASFASPARAREIQNKGVLCQDQLPRAGRAKRTALTNGQLKELVAGRTDIEIGQAIRRMLLRGARRKEVDLELLSKLRLAGCNVTEIAAEMNLHHGGEQPAEGRRVVSRCFRA